jgi:hypothetical protein
MRRIPERSIDINDGKEYLFHIFQPKKMLVNALATACGFSEAIFKRALALWAIRDTPSLLPIQTRAAEIDKRRTLCMLLN